MADFLLPQWNVLNNMVGNQKVSQKWKGLSILIFHSQKDIFPTERNWCLYFLVMIPIISRTVEIISIPSNCPIFLEH